MSRLARFGLAMMIFAVAVILEIDIGVLTGYSYIPFYFLLMFGMVLFIGTE